MRARGRCEGGPVLPRRMMDETVERGSFLILISIFKNAEVWLVSPTLFVALLSGGG